MHKCLLPAVGLALIMTTASRAGDALEGVWVTTDRSVDTSTTRAIVADLVKPGMNEEQKALAIFNWYRRVVYPHNYLADDRRDLLRQINSYGNTLCGSHAANMSYLMREAGFKTRITHIPGHSFFDLWFESDKRWHTLDSETDFAVWSHPKGHPDRHLINMEELAENPGLLDNAVEEGRAEVWLFKAHHHPWTTRKKMAALADKDKSINKMDMQWSCCLLKDDTIIDFFKRGSKQVKHSAENEAYGGQVSDPDLMSIRLRPNETLIRTWDNEGQGKWIRGTGFRGYPAHLLYGGGADENDPVVFSFVEPYRKDNYGLPELPVDRCYRYGGNGHLVWRPASMQEFATADGVKADGAVVDRDAGSLRRSDPQKPGTVTVPIRSSYALVDARIRATWQGKAGTIVLVGKQPTELQPAGEVKAGQPVEYVISKEINRRYSYVLRVELPADGSLAAIEIDNTFVNNWLALPFLSPGDNKVRVRLNNPELLKTSKLEVTYEWAEGDNWKSDKSDTREVKGSPFEYELKTAGPKYPRMKRLILKATPQ